MNLPFLKATGQKTHLYTKGKEFAVGVTEYIGYYHMNGNVPYTGYTNTPTSIKLEKYYDSVGILIYNQLRPDNKKIDTFIPPHDSPIAPTDSQYNAGMFIRYFLVKRNENTKIIYEINPDLVLKYGQENGLDDKLYQLTKMNWAITKNVNLKAQVIADNAINLRLANAELPGLNKYISSLYEYSYEVI